MTELLTVLPFSANDGVLAEHLCDFIFLANKRVKKRHALLVCAADVHAEMREKVKIAADVAFESVEIITAPAVPGPDKNIRINRIFAAAAEHVQKHYRAPWFWLEPDCAPLKAGWFDDIEDAYFNQPKRYFGPWLMSRELFLHRVSVYPPDAYNDLSGYLTQNSPFNWIAGAKVIPASTKTRLIIEVAFTDESVKYNESAVLLHHDKNGILINRLRPEFEAAANRKKK